jgi:hypothetical protein
VVMPPELIAAPSRGAAMLTSEPMPDTSRQSAEHVPPDAGNLRGNPALSRLRELCLAGFVHRANTGLFVAPTKARNELGARVHNVLQPAHGSDR